jgi:hypothetical protein
MTDHGWYENYSDISDLVVGNPGGLVIYTRPGAKKERWSARIRIPGSNRYLDRSTRTTDRQLAINKAIELYREADRNHAMGVTVRVGTFDSVLEKYFQEQEEFQKKTERRLAQYRGMARRYFSPYFGKMKVSSITHQDLQKWLDWRISYWVSGPGKAMKEKRAKELSKGKRRNKKTGAKLTSFGNVAEIPSKKTLQMEVGALKEILRWAFNNNHMPKELNIDTKDALKRLSKPNKESGKAESRRGALDLAGYNRLMKYLKRWADNRGDYGLNTDTPYVDAQVDARHLYQRRLLYDTVQFLGHSMLRTGEMKRAIWSDVQKHRKGHHYLKVNYRYHGKTGQRDVILREEAMEAIERRRTDSSHTKPDDYIFPAENGSVVADQNRTFTKLLERLGLSYDGQGNKLTLYGMRHTSLTLRIQFAKKDGNMDWDFISKNAGTSVSNLRRIYTHEQIHDDADVILGKSKALRKEERGRNKAGNVHDINAARK